jgi:hypothetical protein
MTQQTYEHVSYLARCADNAVYIGIGVAAFLILPRQIKRKLEAGKITEEKAKKISKWIWPMGCAAIGLGILRIIGFLP